MWPLSSRPLLPLGKPSSASQVGKRHLADVTPTKKPNSQKSERLKANTLIEHWGKYSLAVIMPELVANYRDKRFNSLGRVGSRVIVQPSEELECLLQILA